MEGNCDYLVSDQGELKGVNHFAVWPLTQAAQSCFGAKQWPDDHPIPQGWIESATRFLISKEFRLLVANRAEPWGQTVTRLLSPEGLLTGLTITPWLRG